MQAVVYEKYGSPEVLELRDIPKPVPKDDEVLVKTFAAAVNSWDWDVLRGKPFIVRMIGGPIKPRNTILGLDIAGRIEAVGKNVTDFKVGDEVFGDISEYHWGGFAEYVCVSPTPLAFKPPSLSFTAAAALPHAGVLALQGMRLHPQLKAGDKMLINGAGGGVGTIGIQLAKRMGLEVTAVDRTDKLKMLKEVGADHVIDYTKEDFAQNGQQYDLIIDNVAQRSVFTYQKALSPTGAFVMIGGNMGLLLPVIIYGGLLSKWSQKKIGILAHKPSREDLNYLSELIEAGQLAPKVDRVYPLKEVPQALQYFGDGNSQGKLVIEVARPQQLKAEM